MLRVTGGALVGLLLAGCGNGGDQTGATTAPAGAGETTAGPRARGTRGVVFNTASRDVTLFDPSTNRVTGDRPTNAVVRWLSNEQHYWDGKNVWTYDFPDNQLEAIAIDPETFEVSVLEPQTGRPIKRLEVGQNNANVSFRPDGKYGYVAVTGEDAVAVVEMESLEVETRIRAGREPMGLIVL